MSLVLVILKIGHKAPLTVRSFTLIWQAPRHHLEILYPFSPPQRFQLVNNRERENWEREKAGIYPSLPRFPRALYPLYPVSARFFLSMQSERDCRRPLRRRELYPTVLCPHHGERSQTSILQPLPLSSRNDSSLQWGRLRDNQNNDCERLAIPWADEAFLARVVILESHISYCSSKAHERSLYYRGYICNHDTK